MNFFSYFLHIVYSHTLCIIYIYVYIYIYIYIYIYSTYNCRRHLKTTDTCSCVYERVLFISKQKHAHCKTKYFITCQTGDGTWHNFLYNDGSLFDEKILKTVKSRFTHTSTHTHTHSRILTHTYTLRGPHAHTHKLTYIFFVIVLYICFVESFMEISIVFVYLHTETPLNILNKKVYYI